MAKKEKTVELKPRVDKISKEHLEELQQVINSINNLQFKVGQVEGQKHNMLHEIIAAQNKIVKMQDMFSKEYGSFDINIADGTINWDGDEK
jgi:hypothetical protein|tara:strand:+ start:794 stop:1066 length:273 start_codon:yes stop_codon:yes gene_type:complete